MTKLEKLKTLKTLLNDMASNSWTEIKRKEIISAAISSGLDENATWCATKPSSKSKTTRGSYIIAEMINLVESRINKVAPKSMVVAKRAKKVSLSPEQLGGLREVANDSPRGKVKNVVTGGVYAFDALPYTQDDIDEELNLMNTFL